MSARTNTGLQAVGYCEVLPAVRWEPGLMWRVGLQMTHRVPVVEKIKLDVPPGWAVSEYFTFGWVPHENGVVVLARQAYSHSASVGKR